MYQINYSTNLICYTQNLPSVSYNFFLLKNFRSQLNAQHSSIRRMSLITRAAEETVSFEPFLTVSAAPFRFVHHWKQLFNRTELPTAKLRVSSFWVRARLQRDFDDDAAIPRLVAVVTRTVDFGEARCTSREKELPSRRPTSTFYTPRSGFSD